MNCLQRMSVVATNPRQIITLSPSIKSSGCRNRVQNRTSFHGVQSAMGVIECNSGRILRSKYDHMWHFAVSSCGSPTGVSLDYTFIMYGLKEECPVVKSSSSYSIHYRLYFLIYNGTLIFLIICLWRENL